MKFKQLTKIASYILFAAILSVGLNANAKSEYNKKEKKEAIVSANKMFVAAFNSGNAKELAELYTEDGKLMPTNSGFVNGKKDIALVWQSIFDAGIKKARLETLEVNGRGKMLYEVGKYTLFTEEGNSADSGKYVVIWKKEGKQWKLHRDIFNTSLPPAEKSK